MNISTRKTRVSMPYRDPSNGEVYFVPADVEVQIIRNYLTHRRVEAAMESVPNLAVEAYEPTLSEFVAALQPGSAAAQERPADAALRERLRKALKSLPHVDSDGVLETGYTIRDLEFNLFPALAAQPSPEPQESADAPRSGTEGE